MPMNIADAGTSLRLEVSGEALAFRVLLSPLRQGCVLLLLRELEMLFAEEPEPGPLRSVLAAGIVAAHVELTTAEFVRDTIPGNTSSRRRRENGRDAFSEELGKAIDQHVKW